MPHEQVDIDVEYASDIFVNFIHDHSGNYAFKEYSLALGYKTWFFTPQKKQNLFQELFFLHYAMAKFAVSRINANNSVKSILRKLILYKIKKYDLKKFSVSDPTLIDRFKIHTSEYENLLNDGGDVIGLSSIFLSQLYRDPNKSLDLVASMQFLPLMLSALETIVDLASAMNIEIDLYGEEDDDDF